MLLQAQIRRRDRGAANDRVLTGPGVNEARISEDESLHAQKLHLDWKVKGLLLAVWGIFTSALRPDGVSPIDVRMLPACLRTGRRRPRRSSAPGTEARPDTRGERGAGILEYRMPPNARSAESAHATVAAPRLDTGPGVGSILFHGQDHSEHGPQPRDGI